MSWMPRDRWDALVRGEDCPLCASVSSTAAFDDYSFVVADLPSGRLRLSRDQLVAGYCFLICHRHVREPHELPAGERRQFFDDMTRAGAALEQAFGADKVNYEILGNSVPHLHAHIRPRYYGDPAGGRPVRAEDGELLLSDEDYALRVELIRAAIA